MRNLAYGACALALLMITTLDARQSARSRSPAGPREQAVPFATGERLTYDVSWSNLLTAGTATVTVHDKRPSYDSVAHYITAEGRATGLVAALYTIYYKADTLLDAFTLLPQRSSLYSDEKGRRRYSVAKFDRPAHAVDYQVQSGEPAKTTSQREAVPPEAHDALSAIFALRATTLVRGAKLPMPVVVNGRVYRVEMAVVGRERVRCGLGEIDAWRVTPTLLDERDRAAGRDMAIWLSHDARRLPVKLQGALPVGTFMLTLTGITRGP